MGRLRRTMCLLGLVSISAWACESGESEPGVPDVDCRNAQQACGDGFVCQMNASGRYECLTDNSVHGGVVAEGGSDEHTNAAGGIENSMTSGGSER